MGPHVQSVGDRDVLLSQANASIVISSFGSTYGELETEKKESNPNLYFKPSAKGVSAIAPPPPMN